ncbi:hypothetical protein BK708_27600 [Bacillus thuringiensis serovar yunnanensis]|nr:hypothetical protein BK708_27600 [Bacillus thuringiensis serovar yunnanensis]
MLKLKSKIKKIIPASMACATLLTVAPLSSFAAENEVQTNHASSQQGVQAFHPSEEAISFMSKVVKSGAIKEFDYSPDLKTMSYKHDMDTIKNTYSFNDEDIAKLEHIVNFYNANMKNNPIATGSLTDQRLSQIMRDRLQLIETDYGWTWVKLTFTNEETKLMLAGAAAEGAYAMYAVFVGMSAITATPVGGAIMVVLGGLGLPKFASVCQTVGRALAGGKGVSVEIGMDGVIPYISASVARH